MSSSDTSSTSTLSVTLPQQAIHVVRQLVNAQGWAKTISDIYAGGRFLSEGPQVDDLSWILLPEQLAKLTAEQQEAYLAKDKAWSEKEVTFTVTTTEKELITRAFQHNVDQLVKAGKLGPNAVLFSIIEAFDIKDAPADKAA